MGADLSERTRVRRLPAHQVAYRAALHGTVPGRFVPLTDPGEKGRALEAVSEHSAPGRYRHLRPATPEELAATSVLALSLDEWWVGAPVPDHVRAVQAPGGGS